MRKFLCIVCLVLMCFGVVACGKKDSTDNKVGGESQSAVNSVGNTQTDKAESNESYFQWDGTKIIGCTESGLKQTNLVIPAKCTAIRGLQGNTSVKSLSFENPDTVIMGVAFKGCTALEKVELPSNLKKFEMQAFMDCTSLKQIVIPDSVVEMESNVFAGCTSLESAHIGAGLQTITGSTFEMCKSLKSITIPDGITTIGAYAFNKCEALESITFGKGVKTIEKYAFEECDSLKEVRIPEGVTTIGTEAFFNCKLMENVYIPSSVTSIGTYGFIQVHDYNVYVVKGSYAEQYIDSLKETEKVYMTKKYQ